MFFGGHFGNLQKSSYIDRDKMLQNIVLQFYRDNAYLTLLTSCENEHYMILNDLLADILDIGEILVPAEAHWKGKWVFLPNFEFTIFERIF